MNPMPTYSYIPLGFIDVSDQHGVHGYCSSYSSHHTHQNNHYNIQVWLAAMGFKLQIWLLYCPPGLYSAVNIL